MIIGYLGGTRIDYQGYPSKGGILPDDINLAIDAMRRAKKKQGKHFNARWSDKDYVEILNGDKRQTIKMKNLWTLKL